MIDDEGGRGSRGGERIRAIMRDASEDDLRAIHKELDRRLGLTLHGRMTRAYQLAKGAAQRLGLELVGGIRPVDGKTPDGGVGMGWRALVRVKNGAGWPWSAEVGEHELEDPAAWVDSIARVKSTIAMVGAGEAAERAALEDTSRRIADWSGSFRATGAEAPEPPFRAEWTAAAREAANRAAVNVAAAQVVRLAEAGVGVSETFQRYQEANLSALWRSITVGHGRVIAGDASSFLGADLSAEGERHIEGRGANLIAGDMSSFLDAGPYRRAGRASPPDRLIDSGEIAQALARDSAAGLPESEVMERVDQLRRTILRAAGGEPKLIIERARRPYDKT